MSSLVTLLKLKLNGFIFLWWEFLKPSELLSATVIFMTWHTPLLKSLMLSAAGNTATVCMTVCIELKKTVVVLPSHLLPSYLKNSNKQSQYSTMNHQTSLSHSVRNCMQRPPCTHRWAIILNVWDMQKWERDLFTLATLPFHMWERFHFTTLRSCRMLLAGVQRAWRNWCVSRTSCCDAQRLLKKGRHFVTFNDMDWFVT